MLSKLVLASASPRRHALIGLLNLPWRAAPADVDEAHYALPDPLVGALNVAAAKARTVAAADGEVVVAADTLVVADGEVLGKPDNAAQARAMLRKLRARPHVVMTGVVLRASGEQSWGGVASTRVTLRDYSDGEIDTYIARGEPFDKAGAYAVQDTAFRPVAGLDGCYLNAVGMPLCAVAVGLAGLGLQLNAPATIAPPCDYCRLGVERVAIRSGD